MNRFFFICAFFTLVVSCTYAQTFEIGGQSLNRSQLKSFIRSDETNLSAIEEYQTLVLEKNYLLFEKYMDESIALGEKPGYSMPVINQREHFEKIDSLTPLFYTFKSATTSRKEILLKDPGFDAANKKAENAATKEEKQQGEKERMQAMEHLYNTNSVFKYFSDIQKDAAKRMWLAVQHYTLNTYKEAKTMIPLAEIQAFSIKEDNYPDVMVLNDRISELHDFLLQKVNQFLQGKK